MEDPRLERIEEYIHPSQGAICRSEDRYIMIEGVAGSRKTDTLIRLGLRRHLKGKTNLLFLTQVGSVTDELCHRIGAYLNVPIYRQNNSNHYVGYSHGKTIEVANFDAWIHRQLEDQEWPLLRTMGAYHSYKIEALMQMVETIKGFCMKNGEYADEVYIDECQDFEIPRARLIVRMLQHLPRVRAGLAGDYMQTLFERSLGEDGLHPMRLFGTLPKIRRFHLDRCYRCPSSHIAFCNLVMEKAVAQHGCRPLEAVLDHGHRPFLFPHGSMSKQYDVHQLTAQCCEMLGILHRRDPSIVPSDVCFLMRRCNDQTVFAFLRVRLEAFWSARGYRNAVIHFATQFDGYRNSIQWNFAEDKTCLLSIHGDKGKSHKVVFLLGLTQKSIPDECSLHKETELLYQSLLNVALTRSTRYLLVGFHHAQPSLYLSRIIHRIEDEACLGWRPQEDGLYRDLASTIRFPEPVFTQPAREQALLIPTLRFLTVTEVSRRYERPEDLLGFHPKLETVVFGRRIQLHVPHDLYPILGYMAELISLRIVNASLFRKDMEMMLDPSRVLFAEDERLLCWVHDFDLHRWIGTDMYLQQLRAMQEAHRAILESDPSLRDLVRRLEDRPSYVLPRCFDTARFRESIRQIVAMGDEEVEDWTGWWNLALLFREIKDAQRNPYLYRYIDMELSARQRQQLRVMMSNIRNLASRFSTDIVFHPQHDLLAHINDATTLERLGFTMETDEMYFRNGYHYGIVGESDVMDRGNGVLYEIKASHLDISIEWLLQTSLYGSLPFRHASSGRMANLVLANVVTGKLYRWERPHLRPRTLIDKMFAGFPSSLKEYLYKSNHRRFKKMFIQQET